MLGLFILSASGGGVELGTRHKTILPCAVAGETPPVAPSNVAEYVTSDYGKWTWGPGTNEGQKLTLMPEGYAGATNVARLLSFFSLADVHITDKESPAQVPYLGWSAAFGDPGMAYLNPSAYSPVVLDTTHRLDAAVKTINDLHRVIPFHFGMILGDMCNSGQHNELRWFIDVMDGQHITPSSGAHVGADTIDYQKPFQAVGLNRSIPWYAAIGNHDQAWMGIGYPSEKIQQTMVSSNVLNISINGPLLPPGAEGSGMYVGVVDGTTPNGSVIKWGETNLFATPPTVVADGDRRMLSTTLDSPTNFVNAFFTTTSLPVGHGFTHGISGSLAACYSFEPLEGMPVKVIVLDNTCKADEPGKTAAFYGGGWVDAARYNWLTNELQTGQDADQLLFLACHIPILPQKSAADTTRVNTFSDPESETNLVATLHRYPNLVLVMAGHRHQNVITPFPSPDPDRPEYGFWQVETVSMRDFPQQMCAWEILRNSDNSISILTTSVDPAADPDSLAWRSRAYGIAAERIFGRQPLDDTSSRTYNAELVVQLTPAMQTKIAGYGTSLAYRTYIGHTENGMEVSFLGSLESADTVSGPWHDVPSATNSPWRVSAPKESEFFRAVK
ncbi:MAG: TIGR03768 family metallophosphoesterase [FCB group bacterium]|nr:TIGR03768 family metallophosphoesterase [FCB group bacterium]